MDAIVRRKFFGGVLVDESMKATSARAIVVKEFRAENHRIIPEISVCWQEDVNGVQIGKAFEDIASNELLWSIFVEVAGRDFEEMKA